ncbi:DUF1127 domain-containing protein [Thalassococcus sp. BH17M4-6]|uniref:DUF1127 domain-containing protein n=1 Tax=Thalassococcus sp. BH17M4-6 TaxID=3413148 RepID=UPI003BDA54CB
MAQTSHAPHLAFLGNETALAPQAAVALYVAVVLTKWSTRYRTRRALAKLDPHLLKDVGITPAEARAEAARRFWRG